MKKFLLILICLMFANPIFAVTCSESVLCIQPYDMSLRGTQILSSMTGMNFLGRNIVQSVIKKELKKATRAKFKVKVKSFSANDLIAGRFKSLDITANNISVDGIYITSFKTSTICDFNYINIGKNNKITFKEAMPLAFEVVITDEDLKKMINSSEYMDLLKMVNLNALGIKFFSISDVDVKLYNQRLYFILKAKSDFLRTNLPMNFVCSAALKIKDGKFVLTETRLDNIRGTINTAGVAKLLNIINPLTFAMELIEDNKSQVSIKNLNIEDNKITIDGTVVVPKNYVGK